MSFRSVDKEAPVNPPSSHPDDPWTRSQSFTLRIWCEQVETGQREVRMQVRHILSGETRYFREWAMLEGYVMGKLEEVEG